MDTISEYNKSIINKSWNEIINIHPPPSGFCSFFSSINSMWRSVSSGNNSRGIRWPVKNPRRSGKSGLSLVGSGI